MVVGSIGGTAYLWVLWHLNNKDVKKIREEGLANLDYREGYVRNLMIGAIVSTIFTVSMFFSLFFSLFLLIIGHSTISNFFLRRMTDG